MAKVKKDLEALKREFISLTKQIVPLEERLRIVKEELRVHQKLIDDVLSYKETLTAPPKQDLPRQFSELEKEVMRRLNLQNMNFSIRIKNVFGENKIVTIDDLLRQTENDLRRLANLGKSSINEIIYELSNHKLKLHVKS